MKNTAEQIGRETEAFYGTNVDTFYLDSTGQGWLIQSVDPIGKPEKASIPVNAIQLSEGILDDQNREDAETIEATYRWIVGTEAGDGLNHKTFDSLEEAKAAVERACGDGYWYEENMPGDARNQWLYSDGGETLAEIQPA